MSVPNDTYVQGPVDLVTMKVDSSSSDIKVGDHLVAGTAGYVQQDSGGGTLVGIAWSQVDAPSSDGDAEVKVNINPNTIYRRKPDTGSVTQAIANTTMDTGGAQSINIDASSVDNVTCVGVDTVKNELLVKYTFSYAGVV